MLKIFTRPQQNPLNLSSCFLLVMQTEVRCSSIGLIIILFILCSRAVTKTTMVIIFNPFLAKNFFLREWTELKYKQILKPLSCYIFCLPVNVLFKGVGIKIVLVLNVPSIKHEKVTQVQKKAVKVDVQPVKSDLLIWYRLVVCFCFRRV